MKSSCYDDRTWRGVEGCILTPTLGVLGKTVVRYNMGVLPVYFCCCTQLVFNYINSARESSHDDIGPC